MAEVYLDDEGIDWSKIPDDVDDKGIDWSKIPDSESKPVQVPTLDEVAGMFSESQGKPFDKRYVADLFALSEATGLYPDVLHDVRPELESRMFQVGRGDTIFTDAAKRQFYLPNAKQVEKEAFKSFKSKTKAMQTMDLIEVYGRYRDEDNGRKGLQAVWDAETISQLKRLDLPDKFYFSPLHMRDAMGADLDKFLSTVGIEPVVFNEAVKNNIPLVIHATDMMSTEARGYQEKLRPIFHEDTDHIPGPDLTAKRAVGAVGEAGKDYARNSLIAQKAKIDSFLANDVGSDVLRDPGLSTELVEGMLGSTVGTENRTKLKELSDVLGDMAQKIERDPKYLESSGLIEDLLRQTPQMAASMATYLITAGIVRGGVAGLAKLAGPLYEAGTVAKVAGAVGSTTSTGLMFDQVFGGTIDELTRSGVPEDRIMPAALVNAVIQTPLEMVGLKGILKSFPSLGSQLGKVLFNIGEAVGKESLTEGLQEYPDEWSKLWAKNGDATTGELLLKALKQLPETTKNAAYSALIGGIMGGAGATVGAGVTALTEVRQRKTTLDQFMTIIDELKRKVEKQGIAKGATPAESVVPGAQGEGEIPVASPINVGIPESDEGRTKAPVGYQPPPGRSLDDEVELVKAAMAHIESGGKYDVRDKTGGQGYGKYQYEPGTWEDFSKEYTQTLYQEATVLPMTPENQENVTDFKVRQWLEQGYSPRQIAARWNSGSANWYGKTGRNKKSGAYYDVPRHVRRFEEAYNAIASGKSVPMMREDIARSLGQHRNLGPRQVDKLMGLMDAAAASWAETYGREADEWYGSAFADVEIGSGEYGRGLGQYAGANAAGFFEATQQGKIFKGKYDQKSRYEIDDSMATLRLENIPKNTFNSGLLSIPFTLGSQGGLTLKDVLKHDKLFYNYPQLADIPIKSTGFSFGILGAYNDAQKTIYMNGGKPEEFMKTLLHEIQHAIQSIEGFASGGNTALYLPDNYNDIKKELQKELKSVEDRARQHVRLYNPYTIQSILDNLEKGRTLPDYQSKMWDELQSFPDIDRLTQLKRRQIELQQVEAEALDRYLKTAGEIEARDVAARANLTPEERDQVPPYSSENIAPGDAIVRFGVVGEGATQFSVVPNAEARRLEKGKKIKLYRAMQLIDGKLYPPMSAKVGGKLRRPTEIGQWERADEMPELATDAGKFKLDKGNKKSIEARYNPYFHTSRSPLNDQFAEAYKRPNLVTVEVEIPESELTSGYKAEKAKDAVGEVKWPPGPVTKQLLSGKRRTVILSRYAKVLRIVPDSEVADIITDMLKGENVTIPENVVTPSLKAELVRRGVPIGDLGKAAPEIIQRDTGEFVKQKDVDQATVDQLKADLLARRARNQLFQSAWHGTPHKFSKFSLEHVGSGEGAQAVGWGLYFASSREVSEWYRTRLSPSADAWYDDVWEGATAYVDETLTDLLEDISNPTPQDLKNLALDEAREAENAAEGRGAVKFAGRIIKRIKSLDANKFMVKDGKLFYGDKAYADALNDPGQLYRVDIPDDSDLLIWDKPLSEQSEKVKAAALRFFDTVGEEPNLRLRGESFYDTVGNYMARHDTENKDKDASEYLRSIGIPGHRYPEGLLGGGGKGGYNYVIYDDEAVKILETFYQGGDKYKGAVEFLDDGRAILRLFETADVTTIVHEVAHILRKQLSPDDLSVLEQWAGVKEGQWIDLDLMRQSDEARASGDIEKADRLAREAASAEEKFARAFERYVMDGKAPTWKLKEVFAKLKKWMLDVYKAVTAIDVDIPDDVRGVFDRLLTTEAQRKNNILYQMDDDYSWVEAATEEIPIESMDSYEKVSAEASRRAHLQVERQVEKKRKVREAQWRKEAIQQLVEDPMWMLVSHVRQSGGINLKSVRNQFGPDMVKALARRFPGIIQEGGKVTLDELAADYGYVGDDALAQAIIDFPTKAEYVDSYIESMGKEYEESDEDELLEWQERYVEAEIEIFNKLLGPEFKREEKAPKGIKQKIREMTGQIKVGTALEGGDYQNLVRGMKMASRAAKTAFLQGKIDGARREKIRQRDIMQRARVMLEAKKEAKKIQKELQKWVKAKNIDHEYKEQLATLLSPYEFKTRSKRTQARLDSLQAFIDRMEAEGEAVNIPKGLLERLTKKPIGQLTLAELRELHDVAAQMVHLGKLKKQLIDRKAKRDFDAVMRIVLDTIQQKARSFEELPGRPLAPSERRKDSAVGRLFQKADSWHTQLLQVEFLIRMLDGFEEMGPCYRELFLPIKHAEDEKWILLERIAKKWDEIRAPVRDEMARWSVDRVEVPGFGRMLTREEHLMIALHSRHEDNIRALTGGNKYTDAERQAILDSLSPAENEFLDKIVNELIPIPKTLLQDTHKKLHGVPLRMVQGDYVPMKFDREASDFIEEKKMTAEAMKYFKDYFAGVYMEKGMTIERKGGKQPLLLSFSAIFEHLSDTVQFATHGLPVRNLLKIFEDRAFKETVKMAHGENVLNQLKPWLKEVASPGAKPLLPLEGLLGKIRKNAVLFIMAYRFSTAIQQPLALLNAVDELGGGPVLDAAALYLSDWANQRENIRALSPAIRNRASSFERDIAAATREFDITKAKWREGYEKSAFVLTAFLDGIAAEITWLGAYTEAINGKVANMGAGSEARAIDYADGVVNRTQGSGTSKNLAMISRGGEAHKLFLTFFMTFFNTNHNRLWESYQKLRLPGYEYNFLDFAKSIMLVVIVPAILSNLVSGEESEPTEMAKSVGRYLVSGIPFIREGVAAATGYQYRGGLLGSVMNEAYMLGKTVASEKDKQKTWHLMNRFLKIGGLTTGFPPDQALIILNAAMEDKNKSFSLWDLMSRRTHRE